MNTLGKKLHRTAALLINGRFPLHGLCGSAPAVLVTVCVLLAAAPAAYSQDNQNDHSPRFIHTSCGEPDAEGLNILVAYDSKYASTGGVAFKLGLVLCGHGHRVDIVHVDNATNVDSYNAVVLGSPIYYGFWLKGARSFLDQNGSILADLPVAYFITCNLLRDDRDTPENRQKTYDVYVQPVLDAYPEIVPLENIGLFAGKVDFSDYTAFEWFIMKLAGYYDNDSRSWTKIASWADEISMLLE